MTIYDLSEFDINKRLANLLGLEVQEIDNTRSTGMTAWYHHHFPHTVWVTDRETPWRQFCATRTWEDIGPTITRLQISLSPESHDGREGTENSERWMANVYYSGGEEFTTQYVERPELAASLAALIALSGTEFIK
ncbi:DUF2591 family protein [Klebsiella grimontii]|uniref:DUF2591 family protein n=1 Tax=Klebsiella grimontii TaxID=2058152 RepID=UPI0012B98D59|nr:DUF2591 family protein [Klebsiella grimontii]ELK6574856.1 DUF2591 family protein [Klebsiella michiganensis]